MALIEVAVHPDSNEFMLLDMHSSRLGRTAECPHGHCAYKFASPDSIANLASFETQRTDVPFPQQYFALAWVLRRPVWKFITVAHENFITYNVFKGLLNEWIPQIKQKFYFALGYSAVGASGAVGSLFNVQREYSLRNLAASVRS